MHQELDLSVYQSIRFAQPLLYGDAVLGKGNGDGNIALASTQTEAAAQRRGLVSFLPRIGEELLQVLADDSRQATGLVPRNESDGHDLSR